jgi:SpoVK/Ycf46/Vps4 family AAA+-type ATPase
VSLKGNRLAGDVNLTQVAQKLEGYTGSDIKEVCREAVVRISHEEALRLEQMGISSSRPIIVKQSKFVKADTDCTEDEYDEDVDKDEDEFNLDTLSAPEFENGYGKRQEAILRPVREYAMYMKLFSVSFIQ